MLATPDQRTQLADPTPPPATSNPIEAVFVGGASSFGAITTPADLATSALDDGSRAAIAAALDGANRLGIAQSASDTGLEGLPLVFDSAAGFAAAFPGDDGWLARAVRDYFAAGGGRAWVVRVAGDDAAAQARRVTLAMAIPSAGLLLAPDLENEFLTAADALIPLPIAASPAPAFRPAADFATPRQPPLGAAGAGSPSSASVELASVVQATLHNVNSSLATRPDMLFLFALPIGADQFSSIRTLVARADSYLAGDPLQQTQVFAPLLRDPSGEIASPSARIAGALAQAARSLGVWRSLAGLVLPLGGVPLRRIESNALASLRDLGVVTLRYVGSGAAMDDDILALASGSLDRFAGARRLRGWIIRSLETLGEGLVFENQLDDGRVELALTNFFAQLLRLGALDGKQTTDAFRIVSHPQIKGRAQFDIYVSIANAIETIRLQFVDGEVTATLGAAA